MGLHIREGTERDDPVLVRHYLGLWDSYGTPAEHYRSDAEVRILAYIAESRAQRRLGFFVAEDEGEAIGSAACQIFPAPYPEVVAPEHRLFGYIWCVYVDQRHRRRGAARLLTERAVQHLRDLGCTHAVLHASDPGQPLYEQIGFRLAKEMRMPLR